MEKKISTSEAKRKLSSILRRARGGDSYVVTSRVKPIARIVPAHKHESIARAARTALLSRLETQPLVKIGRWMRDELYEDQR
jgi:prevent-host-death family protein